MSDQRALQAIDRIEQAFARVEAATRAGRQLSPGTQPDSSPDADQLLRLRETNHALRGKVEDAIAQIDRLLATQGAE